MCDVNRLIREEATPVFYKMNHFVFPTSSMVKIFLKSNIRLPFKRNNLSRISLSLGDWGRVDWEGIYKLLLICPRLEEVHLFFREYRVADQVSADSIDLLGDHFRYIDIWCRHNNLKVIRCSDASRVPGEKTADCAAAYILHHLSLEGSKCKVYRNGSEMYLEDYWGLEESLEDSMANVVGKGSQVTNESSRDCLVQ